MIHVRFHCDEPPTDLVALLGPERPDVSSGYGGWEEVERPRRPTVTTWRGQPARRLALSVLFDNFAGGESVEPEIRRLERMALPRPGGQPPTVTVTALGGVIPPFYEGLPWVIDAISWGDALMNQHGNRTRQFVTVTLLQYVADELVQRSPAKARRAKQARATGSTRNHSARSKRVMLRAGDTLLSVAARELGSSGRWREIALLNDIRDPRAVRAGQTVRLP